MYIAEGRFEFQQLPETQTALIKQAKIDTKKLKKKEEIYFTVVYSDKGPKAQ